MPKFNDKNKGYQYDDYEDYDDYDYDYDYDVEESGGSLGSKQETPKMGVWSCSICSYDNDESMYLCDICGVLRTSLVSVSGNDSNRTVGGICENSGVSVMAKSLFASLPHRTPKQAIVVQQQNNGFVMEEGSSSTQKADSANALMPKGKQHSVDKSNSSKKKMVRASSKSSSVMPKERPDAVDDSIGSFVDGAEACSDTGNLTSNLKKMSLTVKSGNSTSVSARGANSHSQYKPEKWMLPDKTGDELTQLNVAIVGHFDAGKSTLSGRLLYLLGQISQKQMYKYEKEAKMRGKASFACAWALDESAEERERGVTMTVAVAYFDSKKYHVVVLDSPGHKDFVPNLISGATHSDAAILVVDASVGAFEVGMDNTKGQTREHVQLVRSFDVGQLIVSVNKMDAIQYSKDRFDSIKLQLGTFLRSCGFKDSSVTWIPLSAMENQNLVAAPDDVKLLSWYQGPCLLDAIDSLQSPSRDFSKPLLMPICDVVNLQHEHVSACGKLEAGALRSGLKVLVMPCGEVVTVHSIERDTRCCSVARAGDSIAVSLQGIDISKVMSGGVLCHPDFPVAVATHLELKILILEFAPPILIGSQLECHVRHAKEAARIVKILQLLDTKTGKVTKKSPRCLAAKQGAIVEVALQGPVCVEEFSNCRPLGRVILRSLGRTIAVGIVTRIMEDQQ